MPLSKAEAAELHHLVQTIIDRRDRLMDAIHLDMPKHLIHDQQLYMDQARGDFNAYINSITQAPKPRKRRVS